MDAETWNRSREYELLTQSIYQAILRQEGYHNIDVLHDKDITGRSGVAHQVDVSWKYTQAGIEHHVLIECKDFNSPLTLEKIRNFFAVLHDTGASRGVMVTKTGYQSGVEAFAKFYKIGLKILREPTEEDWEGRIRNIGFQLNIVTLATAGDKAPRLSLNVTGDNASEIQDKLRTGLLVPVAPGTQGLVDQNGKSLVAEWDQLFRSALKTAKREVGGPFAADFPLPGYFLIVRDRTDKELCIPLASCRVEYWNELVATSEFMIYGDEVVKFILKDFFTDTVEHVNRR